MLTFSFSLEETVEILEWVALLWILALAKARSAAPISAAISAKRATQASAKIHSNPGGREAEGQLAPKAFGAGCVARSLQPAAHPDHLIHGVQFASIMQKMAEPE